MSEISKAVGQALRVPAPEVTSKRSRELLDEILADPVKRRKLAALVLIAEAARQGRDLALDDAYAAYDEVQNEKNQSSESSG